MEDKKLLMTFDHVLGAKLADVTLKRKGIDVELDDLPVEGDAKVYVKTEQYDEAKKAWEDYKHEIQAKVGMHLFKD